MTAGRPLTGKSKRTKFTTTVDASLVAIGRECARAQHMTFPALIEKLLTAEIKRRAAEDSVISAAGAAAGEDRATRRAKGK